MDIKDFKIPRPPNTPLANRVSKWTPGSGFSECSIEVIGRRDLPKRVTSRTRRSEPSPIVRGKTLDLITRPGKQPLARKTLDVPGNQDSGTSILQLETGVLSSDIALTWAGNESCSFQPAENSDTVATENSGTVVAATVQLNCIVANGGAAFPEASA